MRIVLDTNVLVAGLRSQRGASFEILIRIAEGKLIILATPTLFLEYEDVLYRPEHRLVHGISPAGLEIFLQDLSQKIEPVDARWRWRPQLRDANDEMVLEAAINGKADAIVTFNRRDFLPAAEEFGIKILSPVQILRREKR